MESSIPNDYLIGTDSKGTIFSFKTLYGLDKRNIDLNIDFDYFLNKVLTDYEKLLKFSKISSTFTVIKNQIGSTYTMPFKLDFFNNIYGLNIDKNDEYASRLLWYSTGTDNFNDILLSRIFFEKPIDVLNDEIDISDLYKDVSPNYYSLFALQWQKTLVMKEAIRYALTHSDWIYSKKQLDFFKGLAFMRYETNEFNYVQKHGTNLEYMRKLYEVNDKKIENIFYIILALFDKHSDKTLYNLFGDPQKYSNEEYANRIYDSFYEEILIDTDKFMNYS
ncbi:MAG: hypothetical protein K2L64_01910, partial [Ureaplasma sp.]|nr:hypothetical protein [Ureaplasma sp.]